MASTRQLKTKIGAVKNIKQITKAMQMVAATKMRRSQEVALNARPYAKKSFALLLHLLKQANGEDLGSIFWKQRNGKKIALVVITSDKGLAGSFNSSVLRQAAQWKTAQEAEGREIDIVAVGKKGRDFFKARGGNVIAEFLQFSDVVTFQDVRPLADWIVQTYEIHGYDKIVVCSNQFVSALVQKVEVRQLLPLEPDALKETIEDIIPKTGKYSELAREEQEAERDLSYVLEPSREEIVKNLVRGLIQVEIAYFVFESNASEHSARMVAMKSATENADRLQEELQLVLNKARQAAITQELTEIATAKEALTAK
ncbi:MAG: ATP synthase F1 subunit gamma [Candidatus Wildermuthbacteria bacterium]|nr:ATP synthase F1 subunit gamma [Candidatus Wildermuthbacteria bacterium]